MHSNERDEDDWFARQIGTLRPGWRGRVLLTPEDADSGATEGVVGTIVGEADLDRDDDDAVVDATITLCTNYEGGRFVPLAGQDRVAIRLSRILHVEPL